MTLKEFRAALLDQLIAFLWRQWSALGVLGESEAGDNWVIDPEALLIFSLQIARYEPRLFNEILSWVRVNGRLLDASRLRNMLQNCPLDTLQVVGGTLHYVSSHPEGRKWKNLANVCAELFKKQPRAGSIDTLFKEKSGTSYLPTAGDESDPYFIPFYLNSQKITIQKQSRDVPINTQTNLRFLLRAFFGVGGKSECILYLLTHEGGRPKEIEDAVGLFWLGIQKNLTELAKSGLVLTRSRGKRVEYWLSHRKWWEFLASSDPENFSPPKWLNWIAIYSALSVLWKTLDDLGTKEQEYTDYMKMSKLQDSLEVLAQEFSRAGYDMPRIPALSMPEDLRQSEILKFLAKIFGLETPSPLQVEGVYAKS